MLATRVPSPPARPGWICEEKYDGVRILAYKEGAKVRLMTRNDHDRSGDYRAVTAAVAALAPVTLLLDGEVIAVDRHGVSRFQLLQRGGAPLYAVFDCLFAAGSDLRRQPLRLRRQLLEQIVPRTDVLRPAQRLAADARRAYARAAARGFEGILCKDPESTYESTRSPAWLKVKVRKEEEFVVGGFTRPAGSREHFGALLLGAWDDQGRLRYVGKVGTGFTHRTLADLARRMRPLVRAAAPFATPPRANGTTWVKPQLVAQIAYQEWTRDKKLRQPAYLGLRDDKSATEVRMPEAVR